MKFIIDLFLKLSRACLFAGIFFLCAIFGRYVTTFGINYADYMFLCVILTQIILLLTKIETIWEVKIILIYHIVWLVMELFKTNPSIWSRQYSDLWFFSIMTVPLYSGFMYSAVWSFIFQARDLLKLRFINFPKFRFTIPIAVAIYINFFTHHFIYDFRYIIFFLIILVAYNIFAVIEIDSKDRKIHVLFGLLLTWFFIRIAENISTFIGIRKYPNQQFERELVSLQKIFSWFLLFIISFVIVSWTKNKKQKDWTYLYDYKPSKTKYNIAFGWWWSGWHVRPVQSLIEFIHSNHIYDDKISRIFWFGQKDAMEYDIFLQITNKINNLTFVSILSGKFRRQKTIQALRQNIIDIVKFKLWICQSLFFVRKYDIDIIFCKWWFVALPLVIAGAILGKKIYTHESDTKAGIVNTISAKFSIQNFTWFDDVLPNSITIGQILSDDLTKFQSLQIWNQDDKITKTKILVIWWSLWASSIYDAILDIFKSNEKINHNFDFFVVGGILNKELRQKFVDFPNIQVFDFLDTPKLANLYQKCDICITRAWLTTLAETKLFGIKNIIIPIPRTHDQKTNAKFYSEKYGDLTVSQDDADFRIRLEDTILSFVWYQKKQNFDKNIILSQITNTKNIILDKMLDIK